MLFEVRTKGVYERKMYPNSSEGKLITADQAQKVAPVLTAIDAQIFAAIDEAAKKCDSRS